VFHLSSNFYQLILIINPLQSLLQGQVLTVTSNYLMLMTHLDPLIKCRVIFCGMMLDQHFTNHHLIKASNAKTIFSVQGSPTPSASTTPPVSLEKTSNLGSQFRRRFYEVQSDLQLFPGRSFAPTVVTKSTQHTWALHLRRSKTWLRRSSVHWRVRWTRTASFLFFWALVVLYFIHAQMLPIFWTHETKFQIF